MAKKQKVEGSFEGLCAPGDIVRVYYVNGPGSATVLVRSVDCDGDIICDNHGLFHDGFCVEALLCDGIKVTRGAPPKVAREFGDRMRVEIKGDRVEVNGAHVPWLLLCAVAKASGWDCSDDYYSDSELLTAWDRRECKLAPTGFQAGCVGCTVDQLEEALTWIFEILGA